MLRLRNEASQLELQPPPPCSWLNAPSIRSSGLKGSVFDYPSSDYTSGFGALIKNCVVTAGKNRDERARRGSNFRVRIFANAKVTAMVTVKRAGRRRGGQSPLSQRLQAALPMSSSWFIHADHIMAARKPDQNLSWQKYLIPYLLPLLLQLLS